MDDDLDTRIQRKLSEQKNELLSEIQALLKISTETSTSEISKLSSKLVNSELPKFKRKSNEEQYKVNAKVLKSLEEAQCTTDINQTKVLTKEAADTLTHRQKLIMLADTSDLGWRVIHEYETNPLAEDSDDEKRILKAEARATRKFKAERGRRGRGRFTPYARFGQSSLAPRPAPHDKTFTPSTAVKPGLCFACGKPGHWKGECPGTGSNNRMSILLESFGQNLGTKNSVESHAESEKEVESMKMTSPVSRLKQHLSKWSKITSDAYILEVVDNGYKLPFKTIPAGKVLKNNRSALSNTNFVTEEIKNLMIKGVVQEVTEVPFVVNPMTVAYSKSGKPRLVLDRRHINSHLHLFKVKFEDIRVAEFLFEPGSYIYTYDLKSAYHHIDIFEAHRNFLGFSWNFEGKTRYFVYCSLPFGIATARHIFTKVLRVVVTYLRSMGHKVIMFLDNGIGGDASYLKAVNSSKFVQKSILEFGFLIAQEKCNWDPKRSGQWLGYILDFDVNKVFIKQERILRLEKSLEDMLHKVTKDSVPVIGVRNLASIVGQIISLQFVLGKKVQMFTRHMYNCILARASWNSHILISEEAIKELEFWKSNASYLNKGGKSLKREDFCKFFIFCDASAKGYGGYLVSNNSSGIREMHKEMFHLKTCPVGLGNGQWLPEESDGKSVVDESSAKKEVQMGFGKNVLVARTELREVSINIVNKEIQNESFDRNWSKKFSEAVSYAAEKELRSFESQENFSCTKVNKQKATVVQCNSEVVGAWLESEAKISSTWRETEAVRRVIRSNLGVLKANNVKIFSDNKNTASIVLKGSRRNDIQTIASDIANVCAQNKITISSQWIPRVNNIDADTLSRCGDSDDWFISSKCFTYLDSIWGPHSFDRFSTAYNNHCEKFNTR